MSLTLYTWAIWKNCRLVEYVKAYSEWDAIKIARLRHGDNTFVERADFSYSRT